MTLPKEKTRLLIIDDDEDLQTLLQEYFSRTGIETAHALTGRDGLARLTDHGADLVVLDLMMPEMDGFETLRHLRKSSDIPVIMLTALDDETDRIVGLEMGADDYLHKPINPRELLARIKAILRRTKPLTTEGKLETATEGSHIDSSSRSFVLNGRPIDLTAVEFDILYALIQAKGRIVTRDRLMDLARGRDFQAFDRSIDVHISRIRKKVEGNPSKPRLIKTAWGRGYLWEGILP